MSMDIVECESDRVTMMGKASKWIRNFFTKKILEECSFSALRPWIGICTDLMKKTR
jgi:hypothetical protein